MVVAGVVAAQYYSCTAATAPENRQRPLGGVPDIGLNSDCARSIDGDAPTIRAADAELRSGPHPRSATSRPIVACWASWRTPCTRGVRSRIRVCRPRGRRWPSTRSSHCSTALRRFDRAGATAVTALRQFREFVRDIGLDAFHGFHLPILATWMPCRAAEGRPLPRDDAGNLASHPAAALSAAVRRQRGPGSLLFRLRRYNSRVPRHRETGRGRMSTWRSTCSYALATKRPISPQTRRKARCTFTTGSAMAGRSCSRIPRTSRRSARRNWDTWRN